MRFLLAYDLRISKKSAEHMLESLRSGRVPTPYVYKAVEAGRRSYQRRPTRSTKVAWMKGLWRFRRVFARVSEEWADHYMANLSRLLRGEVLDFANMRPAAPDANRLD